MSFEIQIANSPTDFPGVIALVEKSTETGLFSIAEIFPLVDGTHQIIIWPNMGNQPWEFSLEELQEALEEGVRRLATYDGGKYAIPDSDQ